MKKLLSVLLVSILFMFSSSAFAASKQNHLYRLSCPKVLKSCVDVDFLMEEEYLPEYDDLEDLFEDYSSEELQEICKGCCVAESKSSKCISRCIIKCKKEL